MSDLPKRLEAAADFFCHGFLQSSLYTAGELERQGITFKREASGSGLRGSLATGGFFGGSQISLTDLAGNSYIWQVRMLYETGNSWAQGAGYSYVSVGPKNQNDTIPIYAVGSTDFPAYQNGKHLAPSAISEQDWLNFCKDFEELSKKCLADMEFIFRNKLTSKLYELSLQYPDSSQPNPFFQG